MVTVYAMACYVDRQCLNWRLKCFHGDSVYSQKSEKVSPLVDWSMYVIFLLWDMTWKKTTSNFVCVGNYAPLLTPCWPFIHKISVDQAAEMLLLNKKATAQEMYDWGLVSRVIPHDQFKQQTRAMMAEMSQLPPKVRVFTIHKHLNFFLPTYSCNSKISESVEPVFSL